jgi:hypothetical protein
MHKILRPYLKYSTLPLHMHVIRGHFTQVKLVIQISIRKRRVIEAAIPLLQLKCTLC